ncbi:hypothetical protein [Aquibium oceanicum]|uniref:hypothetical protein n=1 Tax=Aquibium oceanicum TaxID=1670800 RepID=UPI0012FF8041|nr:hypothetical protein [Aquibium oceanicum]
MLRSLGNLLFKAVVGLTSGIAILLMIFLNYSGEQATHTGGDESGSVAPQEGD